MNLFGVKSLLEEGFMTRYTSKTRYFVFYSVYQDRIEHKSWPLQISILFITINFSVKYHLSDNKRAAAKFLIDYMIRLKSDAIDAA